MWIPKSLGFDTERKRSWRGLEKLFIWENLREKKKNSNYVPIKLFVGGRSENFSFLLGSEIFHWKSIFQFIILSTLLLRFLLNHSRLKRNPTAGKNIVKVKRNVDNKSWRKHNQTFHWRHFLLPFRFNFFLLFFFLSRLHGVSILTFSWTSEDF